MALVIISLGIMNIYINSAMANLSNEKQRGGLNGVMDVVESISGLIGPALGGLL